jgi:peptidyl-prolyl cis-trans isomerase A (cyclophilin A)
MKKILAAFFAMSITAGALWAQAASQKKPPAPKKSAPAAPKKSTPVTGRSLLNPASLNQKAPEEYKVKFTTTKGDFVIQVTRAWAPLGADRFYNLVKNGHYTDASFFRVISGFMVQFGINAKPAVNAVWQTATIQDDPVKESNKRGYVTFATGGPNTRTTQVFISFGDNSRLDSMGFSPFGQVVEGMDVVDKLYAEYGEGAPQGNGPEQGRVQSEGKAYLDKSFPKLDSIKSAVIVGAPAAAKPAAPKPAAHPAAPAKKKPA